MQAIELVTQINKVKDRILEVTNISEEQRTELFFELGCNWAERYCKVDTIAFQLQQAPEFWAFWSLQYKTIEESFLARVEQRGSCIYVKVTIVKNEEIEATAFFKDDQLRQNYTKTMCIKALEVKPDNSINTLIENM